jgi:UDP-N-acetyl-D-glucosamine dehydrogenase
MASFESKLNDKTVRVGVIGLGYVGLPLVHVFWQAGLHTVGFDIDPGKIEKIEKGETYIKHFASENVRAMTASGRFKATTDFADLRDVDAVLICVPTPLNEDHTPDMSFVVKTVEAIAPHVRAGQLVVLESTTYPGTTEEIVVETLDRLGRGVKVLRQAAGGDVAGGEALETLDGVMVAFSPEREDPGNVVTPRRSIPKVIGGVEVRAATAAEALYGAVFDRTVRMSSPAAAEMTKLLENIYRCVNIALVNELKQLCERMGINIWEVIDAAATKPFGFQAFYPGPGVGGHCIPVDPFYLSWKAEQYGFKTRFIELAGAVNESMPGYVVTTVKRALERTGVTVRGAKVLVLGIAYKRDVDDLRESPALTIVEMLLREGMQVEYNDPFFATVGRGRRYALNMRSTPVNGVEAELGRFDCVLIATDHSTYDYRKIVAEARLVVDSRNATKGIESARIVRC